MTKALTFESPCHHCPNKKWSKKLWKRLLRVQYRNKINNYSHIKRDL